MKISDLRAGVIGTGFIGPVHIEALRRLGVQVVLNAMVKEVRVDGADKERYAVVTLHDGPEIVADCVLYSIGREGSTHGLGLDKVGVRTNARGFILVDDMFRTTVPSIYAAGDAIGFPALAATSMEQARVAMCHAFELKYKERVSPTVPYGIWTIPEIAMIGETEETARAKDLPFETGKASFRTNPRGQIIGAKDGFLKLLFAADTMKLLGVHANTMTRLLREIERPVVGQTEDDG